MARNDFFVLCFQCLVGLLAVQRVAVDRCFGLGLHIFSRTRPHPLLHAAFSTFVGFVCVFIGSVAVHVIGYAIPRDRLVA